MYRVDRNNFYDNRKKATVYTPASVSDFIFSVVSPHISKRRTVFDPCVGAGALLRPFDDAGYKTFGLDIEEQGYPNTWVTNYLVVRQGDLAANSNIRKPSLVVMNPPFNIDGKTKEYIREHYGGRPLLPEVWLQKAIELFGKKIPIVLFTPYGLRLNQCVKSRRWQKFVKGEYPEIASIISLPKDVFEGIMFHSEILIFNIEGLRPHYFYEPARS